MVGIVVMGVDEGATFVVEATGVVAISLFGVGVGV